jgi:release factor glutamine methyltransferase
MLIGPEAMIPRKETEILGRAVLELLQGLVEQRESVTVVDLCTGSGNIALALAHYVPQCHVYASDLSVDALKLARRNARHLGLDTRVAFMKGDLFAPFATSTLQGRIDVVTCNPPYISAQRTAELPEEIREFEPPLAFDGGTFGVTVLMRLLKDAPTYARPGAWLCFEVGLGQGDVFKRRLERDPRYATVRSHRDAQGRIRALCTQTQIT